jgi:hypothetical protein
MNERPTGPDTALFQRPLPAYAILASFVVCTIPIAILGARSEHSAPARAIVILYLALLGLSHFALTPTVYLQSANLRYFNGSVRNRVIYFAVPCVIFVFFDLYSALRIAALFPVFAMGVRTVIRAADFNHLNRQTGGVLQLFKARSGCTFPAWTRRVETLYYAAFSALLLTTFLSGGRFVVNAASVAAGACVAGLFVAMLVAFAMAWGSAASRPAIVPPALYFLFQTGAALLATYDIAFYGAALGMHYVEYHILMAPRCFKARLDSRSRIDRIFGAVRDSRPVFYLILAFLAFVVMASTLDYSAMLSALQGTVSMRSGGTGTLMLLAMFDGLFVFHYFIESFIWRFSEPYYRQSLAPLYFAKRPAVAST